MRDAMFSEKRVQTLILASPISLNNNDPSVKTSFYHILELYEFLEHIIFEFQHVDPNKFTKIIDEGYIVPLTTY
jgi:hypothetical protein